MRGGLPPSFTAANDDAGFLWLEQYVATFLERDIPQLGISIPAATLRRFCTMICHYHGQILNHSELARSFGISDMMKPQKEDGLGHPLFPVKKAGVLFLTKPQKIDSPFFRVHFVLI